MIGSRSSLVVIYQGIDPYYHRRDPDRPNRLTCEPDRAGGAHKSGALRGGGADRL
jgi:hypothetical protein